METIVLSFIIIYIAISIIIQKQLDKLYNEYTGEEININTTMSNFIAKILKENNIEDVKI